MKQLFNLRFSLKLSHNLEIAIDSLFHSLIKKSLYDQILAKKLTSVTISPFQGQVEALLPQ